MPKQAEYRITWSAELQAYELIHTPFHFPIRTTETLHYWLTMANTFHFCSPTGYTLTLRKETKERGGGYWYVYKRVEGKLRKRYIGGKEHITLTLLEALARSFVEPAASSSPAPTPPSPQETARRQPVLPPFARTLESALCICGFATLPTRNALRTRYRELSKQHHPDTGGVHQDMVAVNLAYDYLKKFV